jgi:2-polyprenyl-3-methyl-5-hydroxy-6-metoxy-1,4-benzoquinol methylase
MNKKKRLAWKLHIEATKDQFRQKEISLGPWTSYSLVNDPKHMSFVLSRYKFCAKILEGKKNVLEVGCGDGFGTPIVAQTVKELKCIDWEERNIIGNRKRLRHLKNAKFEVMDLTKDKPKGIYDGIFSIDVIEHLEPENEKIFIQNSVDILDENGILIIGTPNESASNHATHRSDHQHINLKNHKTLKNTLNKYFHNIFIFSMNDEVIHTGFYPMAHYLFAIGVGKK